LQAIKLNIILFSSDIRENSRRFLKEFFDRFTYKVAQFTGKASLNLASTDLMGAGTLKQ
jgi:hypothetical protein